MATQVCQMDVRHDCAIEVKDFCRDIGTAERKRWRLKKTVNMSNEKVSEIDQLTPMVSIGVYCSAMII